MTYCFCGIKLSKMLDGSLQCVFHGTDTKRKKPREKIGKWSGKSKRPYGQYEKY